MNVPPLPCTIYHAHRVMSAHPAYLPLSFRWQNIVIVGQQLLAETLLAATGPVTVIATGPLTNLAWVLDHYPEVKANIDRVLIMGESTDATINVRKTARHQPVRLSPHRTRRRPFRAARAN